MEFNTFTASIFQKTRFLASLSNSITCQVIILIESCSHLQKTWQVFKSALKKCLVLGFIFLWMTP